MASLELTSRRSSRVCGELLALPVVLVALVLAAPDIAVATEPTSGYTTTTETTTSVPPKQETAPSPSTSPSKELEKAKEVEKTAPSREVEKPHEQVRSFNERGQPSAPRARKLPFTGFDLRLIAGLGLFLMGAGFAIVAAQRRLRKRRSR
jgi:uncharacterized surface anchored protein